MSWPTLSTLAERVLFARKKAGLTQEKLALKANVAQQLISRLEQGKVLNSVYLLQIADATDAPFRWLQTGKHSETGSEINDGKLWKISYKNIPLLPWSQVHDWVKMRKLCPDTKYIPIEISENEMLGEGVFGVKVIGDAMTSKDASKDLLYDGDTVAIDPDATISIFDTVFVSTPSGQKLRRYNQDGTERKLEAYNPKYPDIIMDDETEILGKVIKIIRNKD